MSIKQEVLKYLRENKKSFEKKYGVKKIYLFGSVARGEDKKNSDIDLMVEFRENATIFEYMEFEELIKKRFGKKVDLATMEMIKPLIMKSIQRDIIDVT
jgi:predicted nucleotidyltransferase